jgi:hypothetical protein
MYSDRLQVVKMAKREEVGPESGKIQVRLSPQDSDDFWSAKNELEPHLRWSDFYKKMIYRGIEAYKEEKSILDFVKREREKQSILQILTDNPALMESPFGARYKRVDTDQADPKTVGDP